MASAHVTSIPEQGAPPVVHHMDSTTAYHSAKLGIWLFLATEILLFAVLFTAFALYHWWYFDEFHHASSHLNWKWGVTNTAILLFSSYTAAVAVYCAQTGDNKGVFRNLMISCACGGVFLVIKGIEYTEKYNHGYFPGTDGWAKLSDTYANYFGLYYCMTGLHALHVIIGMCLLTWAALKARKNRYSSRYYTPVEVGALYWHLVDLIWIYLFPLLYLIS